jgi:hypothetical protein
MVSSQMDRGDVQCEGACGHWSVQKHVLEDAPVVRARDVIQHRDGLGPLHV